MVGAGRDKGWVLRGTGRHCWEGNWDLWGMCLQLADTGRELGKGWWAGGLGECQSGVWVGAGSPTGGVGGAGSKAGMGLPGNGGRL